MFRVHCLNCIFGPGLNYPKIRALRSPADISDRCIKDGREDLRLCDYHSEMNGDGDDYKPEMKVHNRNL